MGVVERFSAQLAPGDDAGPVIVAALQATERFTEAAALSSASDLRLAVIVEELVSNALRHGARGGGLRLELTLCAEADGVKLDLVDDGIAFDPTAERGFSGPHPESGGSVGLALVRAWARDMAYCREPRSNRLSLTIPDSG
jgi:two-component sensor histidine kinase